MATRRSGLRPHSWAVLVGAEPVSPCEPLGRAVLGKTLELWVSQGAPEKQSQQGVCVCVCAYVSHVFPLCVHVSCMCVRLCIRLNVCCVHVCMCGLCLCRVYARASLVCVYVWRCVCYVHVCICVVCGETVMEADALSWPRRADGVASSAEAAGVGQKEQRFCL